MADIRPYQTVSEIVNWTLVECNLDEASDVFASSTPVVKQMRRLLDSCGQTLVTMYDWRHLIREHTFVTTSAEDYALPDDFSHMIDQTGWNRTDQNPLDGPLSPQLWQRSKADEVTPVLLAFRLRGDSSFSVFPSPPPVGEDIYFEYVSRGWVIDGTDGVTRQDHIQANDDKIKFEPLMVVQYLKLKFLAARGFDTTVVDKEFQNSFERLTGKSFAAPVLNLRGRGAETHLISPRNIPENGYG